MECTIIEKKENTLLARTEVQGTLVFTGTTPSNTHVIEAVAKSFSGDPAVVALRHIYTRYGQQKAGFTAVIYTTPEAKLKYETVSSHLKKKDKAEKKAAAPAKKGG